MRKLNNALSLRVSWSVSANKNSKSWSVSANKNSKRRPSNGHERKNKGNIYGGKLILLREQSKGLHT